jgi:crotonobetainyl-CoA:carnitine CoA-transferase CaiB-like acyl-CoA transferase
MPSPIDGHDVAVPGAFAKLPCSPLASLRPAPSLGEHNADVYGDLLGITPDELASLRGAGVI